MEPAVPARRLSRVKRISVVLSGLLIAAEVALSLVWPHVVPRLAVFPRPATESWYDGCNGHTRSYQRSGPVWGLAEDHTTRACPRAGLPRPIAADRRSPQPRPSGQFERG